MSIITEVIEFNQKAGLLGEEPNPAKEAAYVIEEALEDFNLSRLSLLLAPSKQLSKPRDISRELMKVVIWDETPDIPKYKQVDKCVDSVIFSLGHLAKIGLNEKQIEMCFEAVILANKAKLACPKDEVGKLTKPADFDELYSPEPKIQAILRDASIE